MILCGTAGGCGHRDGPKESPRSQKRSIVNFR